MKKLILTLNIALVFSALCFAAEQPAQTPPDMPEMPKPTAEHEWLQQIVGEWKVETTCQIPGQEPMKFEGTETIGTVGGFWIKAEGKGEVMGTPFASAQILGYDLDKKKYVGSWCDGMSSYLWRYEGTREGDTLTLSTEGPCPIRPGKITKFKEVLTIDDADHKHFTSSYQEENGDWTEMVEINYTRIK